MRRWLAGLQLTVLLPLFALLLLAALWAGVVYQIEQERTLAFQQATSKSDSLAETFELRTMRIFQQVEQVTRFIKFEFEQHGGERDLPRLIAGDVFTAENRQPGDDDQCPRQDHGAQPCGARP